MAKFQIKDFVSIVAGMVNYLRGTNSEITDYNVGSVARTMTESVAQEVDEVYQQFLNGIREAIQTAIFKGFSFPAEAAEAANGVIRVNVTPGSAAVTIAAGSVFVRGDDASITYTSNSAATIAAGASYADIVATCTTTGSAGNCSAGTSFTLQTAPSTFVSAAATADITNGSDAETVDEQLIRFSEYISTISRGPEATLIYGAKTTILYNSAGLAKERVRLAKPVMPYAGDTNLSPALMQLYIHNGVGSTSDELVTACQKVIDGYYDDAGDPVIGWKAAGVVVTVTKATEILLAVAGAMTIDTDLTDEDTARSAVTAAISNHISGLGIGAMLRVSDLIKLARAVTGVIDFVPTSPTANQSPSATAKLMPGAITIALAA